MDMNELQDRRKALAVEVENRNRDVEAIDIQISELRSRHDTHVILIEAAEASMARLDREFPSEAGQQSPSPAITRY